MSVRHLTSIVWLWVASLLIATVGVSGQQIYCYCLGKTSFSLFSAEDACAELKREQMPACCPAPRAKAMHRCCGQERGKAADHGCTRKTTQFFQLKTEFTFQEKSVEEISIPALDKFVALAPTLPVWAVFPSERSIVTVRHAQPPPPVSGRSLCLRHCLFRC